MNVLVLGGTRFIGRHIVDALLASGYRVTVFTRGTSRDELPVVVERLHGDRDRAIDAVAPLVGRAWDACIDVSGSLVERDIGGIFNMAGARLTWATFMQTLGVSSPVWVASDVIRSAGVTSADLPLFVEDGAEHSGIMHVDAARAEAVGFAVTNPAVTVADTRAWLRGSPVKPALSIERERELIAAARARG